MGEWVRGIDSGTQWKEDGGMEGCSNGEKGKRHVIICRSSTSPVNPRSRLTWLIKEAIKGPPPEILRERRERGRRTQATEIERGSDGGEWEKGKEGGGIWERRVLWSLLLFHMSTFPLGFLDEALTRLFSTCIRPSHCDHFWPSSAEWK